VTNTFNFTLQSVI